MMIVISQSDKIVWMNLSYVQCNNDLTRTCCVSVDCARSGDFRSITHHFRTARSVDQSPAVDEYEWQQQLQSDAPAAPHLDSTTRDEMMHMSQKMMDVVDVRIEGMEDMLHHLQTTVHQLGDKVR